MAMINVLNVVGARPNLMKIAPIMRAIAHATPPIPVRLVHTGQHYDREMNGQHFTALIVSPAFAGKRPIQRHQLVYAALGDRMREEIHALSMRTLTPEEYQG